MEVRTLTDAELAGLDVDGVWARLTELQRFTNRLDAYRAKVVATADRKGRSGGGGSAADGRRVGGPHRAGVR